MDWDGWQTALADAFKAGPNQPVFFYIDDEELQALGSDAADLARVVRESLSGYSDPYSNVWIRQWALWRVSSEDPPPTLPLLAMTVYAATRMETSQGLASWNYYDRLAQVLGVTSETYKGRLEHHFGTVAQMWRDLHAWMSTGGGRAYGRSTIRLHNKHYSRIGYPLSQALLRRADLGVLTGLWSQLGVHQGAELTEKALMQELRRWMRTERGLSQRFKETVQHLDGDTEVAFASALRSAALHWDGQLIDEGRRQSRPTLNVFVGQGGELQAEWTFPGASQVATKAFEDRDLYGSRLLHQEGSAQWRAPAVPVVALRWDAFGGRWLSVDGILPGIEHALVFHESAKQSAKVFAQRSDRAGSLKPRVIHGAASGFVEGLEFDSAEHLAEALVVLGLKGRHLRGEMSPRLGVRDGLRVTSAVDSHIYMRGGEPDLITPEGHNSILPVALDGSPATGFRRGQAIPLVKMGIPAGEHRLESIDGSVVFETIEPGQAAGVAGFRSPAVVMRPSLSMDSATALATEDGTYARGGLVHGDKNPWSLRLLTVPRGPDTYVIGTNGQVRRIVEPAASPAWIRLREVVSPTAFNVARRRTEGWLVQVRDGVYSVTQCSPVPADAPATPPANIDWALWRAVLGEAAAQCDTPEWLNLLRSAGVST